MAMTTTAYPNSVVRRRRVRAPNATRAAEQSTTIPSATAVGGIAAFSAGVRLMGAGSQLVSATSARPRSEEHTSELQSQFHLVCRLLLEKKKISIQELLFE